MQCKTVLPHCGHSQLRHMTLRCSLLHHKSPSSWRHTDATLYTVHGQTYMTFVGILASIRWVPRNAFFFAVPKTSNTCLSLRPNFSGDSGSSSPATAVPEISHLTASKQGAMFHAQKFATTTQLWSREKSWNSHIKKKTKNIRSSILPLWCFINDWWLLGLLTVLITLTATVLPPLAALLQSLLKRFLWSIFHHRPQNSSKFLDKGRTGVLHQHKSSAHFSVRVHTNWHHSLQPEGKKQHPKCNSIMALLCAPPSLRFLPEIPSLHSSERAVPCCCQGKLQGQKEFWPWRQVCFSCVAVSLNSLSQSHRSQD